MSIKTRPHLYAHRLTGRVRRILARIEYHPDRAAFRVKRKGEAVFLQHRQAVTCVNSGKKYYQGGRKFYISPHMTDDEILRTAFLAVKIFEEHEINENFLVDGKRFLNPHPEGPRPVKPVRRGSNIYPPGNKPEPPPNPPRPIETREACTCGQRMSGDGWHSRHCARVQSVES